MLKITDLEVGMILTSCGIERKILAIFDGLVFPSGACDFKAGATPMTIEQLNKGGYTIKPDRPDLKVDTPVIVWNDTGYKFKAHFARWGADGRIRTFGDGETSWLTKEITPWQHYRLPTPEELKTGEIED